ncbi:MAG: SRPBCC family protein [Micrococcus sp.]|nr:SRPBCC family protein [Micrococcus sp.]
MTDTSATTDTSAPPSWSVRADRFVAAPAEVVWSVITDLEGMGQHLPTILKLERLSDDAPGTYQVGTRWRETRRMFGQEATEEMEVVGLEEARRTDILAINHGTRYETGFQLEPAGNGATPAGVTLSFHFAARPEGPQPGGLSGTLQRGLTRVMGPVGAALTRRQMAKELELIAHRAEHLAAGGA